MLNQDPRAQGKEFRLRRAELEEALRNGVRRSLGKPWEQATVEDLYHALTLFTRETMAERMAATEERCAALETKRLYYLSMEYLMGRALENNLRNLDLYDLCVSAVQALGFEPDDVFAAEPDLGLGNSGLGRLAACFLDSLATLDLPAYGYGLDYEFGLFRQEIRNGFQVEKVNDWRGYGGAWFIDRWDELCLVPLYGRVEETVDRHGVYNPRWVDWKLIVGAPRDFPIIGHGGMTATSLRLFSARASNEFDMSIFSAGDYVAACESKLSSEAISKILYPSDDAGANQETRLIQEYFLAACAVRDIIRRFKAQHEGFEAFSERVAIHLNGAHPALVIAELMRTLVDENNQNWDYAWDATTRATGYACHTLWTDAFETWPVSMFARVLPRHLQIIYEINRRLLDDVATRWPGDADRLRRMSLIEEGEEKRVRIAHLAMTGSHAVRGVSQLHGELLRRRLAPDFCELWPERFGAVTNGATPRRWLLGANPGLAKLIVDAIGSAWLRDPERLRDLEPYAEDPAFQRAFREVKKASKVRLAEHLAQTLVVDVNPNALFDMHVKRIHEYKRQLLNAMRVIYDYLSVVDDGVVPAFPRVYLFAGKAAPGNWFAKQTIKLIHSVAEVVHREPGAREFMQILFVPDYRVSLAELFIPAADLSEQISTAGTEPSGTGCMKFMMNGAVTIGTLDGANIEIRDAAGPENFFAFGLTSAQTEAFWNGAYYDGVSYYERDVRVRRVLDALHGDRFSPGAAGALEWAFNILLHGGDRYFHLADFGSYLDAQEQAAEAYRDEDRWTRMAILNVARSGRFSSDRAVMEYAHDVWGLRRAGPR